MMPLESVGCLLDDSARRREKHAIALPKMVAALKPTGWAGIASTSSTPESKLNSDETTRERWHGE